jgi:hypothetical protein
VRRAEQKARADRPVVPDNAAAERAKARNLPQEASELMQQLNRVAQQTRNAPAAQSALQRAASASQQAQQAMQQARNQAQQGQAEPARQSQERAAQALDRAAREASQAVKSGVPKPGSESGSKPGSPKTGAAVAQAQQQMSRAQGQLNQGQPGQAQASMRQAAQSLAQAAQQMAAPQQPGQPGQPGQAIGQGRQPGGLPDLSAYGLDKTPNAGKNWGELPGELRTKIVQDMKARYGEDYARMIKYYFEQIASTNPPASRPLSPAPLR